jgi:hypothetical protein
MHITVWVTIVLPGMNEPFFVLHPNHQDVIKYARVNGGSNLDELFEKMENNKHGSVSWSFMMDKVKHSCFTRPRDLEIEVKAVSAYAHLDWS